MWYHSDIAAAADTPMKNGTKKGRGRVFLAASPPAAAAMASPTLFSLSLWGGNRARRRKRKKKIGLTTKDCSSLFVHICRGRERRDGGGEENSSLIPRVHRHSRTSFLFLSFSSSTTTRSEGGTKTRKISPRTLAARPLQVKRTFGLAPLHGRKMRAEFGIHRPG